MVRWCCQECAVPSSCAHLRDHFQSTTNSKRRVSTFLFWKNKLVSRVLFCLEYLLNLVLIVFLFLSFS